MKRIILFLLLAVTLNVQSQHLATLERLRQTQVNNLALPSFDEYYYMKNNSANGYFSSDINLTGKTAVTYVFRGTQLPKDGWSAWMATSGDWEIGYNSAADNMAYYARLLGTSLIGYGAWHNHYFEHTWIITGGAGGTALYIDGVLIQSNATPITFENSTHLFGQGRASDVWMEGQYKDIFIYDDILTGTEITDISTDISNYPIGNLIAYFGPNKTQSTWTSEVNGYTAINQGTTADIELITAEPTYVAPDITGIAYTTIEDNLTAQHTVSHHLQYVGSKLLAGDSDILYQYRADWGNNDHVYDSDNKAFASTVYASHVSEDGTKMFQMNTVTGIGKRTMTTPFSLTTGGALTGLTNLTEAAGAFGVRDIHIDETGTKLYVLDRDTAPNCYIYQYTFGTAWDTTTLTYDSKVFTVTVSESANGLWLSKDGTILLVSYADGSGALKSFSLSTPWDITTAGTADFSFSLGNFYAAPIAVDEYNKVIFLGQSGLVRSYTY